MSRASLSASALSLAPRSERRTWPSPGMLNRTCQLLLSGRWNNWKGRFAAARDAAGLEATSAGVGAGEEPTVMSRTGRRTGLFIALSVIRIAFLRGGQAAGEWAH